MNKNNNILSIEDWQILDKTEEDIEKSNIESYINSDLNNYKIDSNKSINMLDSIILNSKDYINLNNTKYIISLINKSLNSKLFNIILDNTLINKLKNPSLYYTIGKSIANVSYVIVNNICITYNSYTSLLDKTITEKTVNYYYSKAFEIAYLQLINDCINACIPFIIKTNTINLNQNLHFTEKIGINIINDVLLITIKKITYVFSKSYFLNNDLIQDKINNIISKLIENITISFLNNAIEGIFYIIMEKKLII